MSIQKPIRLMFSTITLILLLFGHSDSSYASNFRIDNVSTIPVVAEINGHFPGSTSSYEFVFVHKQNGQVISARVVDIAVDDMGKARFQEADFIEIFSNIGASGSEVRIVVRSLESGQIIQDSQLARACGIVTGHVPFYDDGTDDCDTKGHSEDG